ncbi:MAG: hypothetical protein ACKPJD_15860, partial [Planctomycetaceae bacterium]
MNRTAAGRPVFRFGHCLPLQLAVVTQSGSHPEPLTGTVPLPGFAVLLLVLQQRQLVPVKAFLRRALVENAGDSVAWPASLPGWIHTLC